MAEYTIGEVQGIAALAESLSEWVNSPLPNRADDAELLVGGFEVPVLDRNEVAIGALRVEGNDVTFTNEIKESK